MGLDMYMYKIDKLSDNDSVKANGMSIEEARRNFLCIKKEDFDAEPEMYCDLLPCVTEIVLRDKVFDYQRCMKEHDIPYDSDIVGSFMSREQIGFTFSSGEHVELTRDEYERYIDEADVVYYVMNRENVGYWRNDHDLADFIEAAHMLVGVNTLIQNNGQYSYDDADLLVIRNCGYYFLQPDERRIICDWLLNREEDEYSDDFVRTMNQEGVNIYYHPWW